MNQLRSLFIHLVLGGIVSLQATLAWGNSSSLHFETTGPCAALAYHTESGIAAVVDSLHLEDQMTFCFAEEPNYCSDYSELLLGLATLVESEDHYFCQIKL